MPSRSFRTLSILACAFLAAASELAARRPAGISDSGRSSDANPIPCTSPNRSASDQRWRGSPTTTFSAAT